MGSSFCHGPDTVQKTDVNGSLTALPAKPIAGNHGKAESKLIGYSCKL
jgi:hypothetical protein